VVASFQHCICTVNYNIGTLLTQDRRRVLQISINHKLLLLLHHFKVQITASAMEPNCNTNVNHNTFFQERGLACNSKLENYGRSSLAAGMANHAGEVSDKEKYPVLSGWGLEHGGDNPIPTERKTCSEP